MRKQRWGYAVVALKKKKKKKKKELVEEEIVLSKWVGEVWLWDLVGIYTWGWGQTSSWGSRQATSGERLRMFFFRFFQLGIL